MRNLHFALLVFIGGCSFGVLSTFVKLAYGQGFEVNEVVGSQFVLGFLIIWFVVLFSKRKKLQLKDTLIIIISGIPTGCTGIFYYLSLQTLEASLAIIFLFQFVWIGVLLEWIIDKKRPTIEKYISIVILLIGSFLAAGYATTGETISWIGIGWGSLAALSFSLFIYLSGTVGKDVPSIQKSALLSTGGFIIVTIIFPPIFLFDLPVLTGVFPYGIFLSVFGVVLPPILFSVGMPHVGPGLGTILSASELPVAVIMSAIVLQEVVSHFQWFGVILILVGIMIGNARLLKEEQSSLS